ncbi:MAG: Gfo/Idh/MocA family oxidoreductase [Acidobacteria bacterium]|nr:MAG: Gfo/Idh/MocA family oxidoreductase [Acidobacteriota bacterium]
MKNMQEVTRRDFLKTAALVAAAGSAKPMTAAPAILSSPNPGSIVHYGFIGTGTEGCDLLKRLATIPEGRCIATCDIYAPNLKRGVETIGSNPQTYTGSPTEYRRMLERKDMDAVLIATPLNEHAQMVIDALNAGKHVFVEKTMYFKEEEGEQIRKAAEANSRQVLQIGLQRRSSVLYNVAVQMIRKGALGKVMFVRTQWHRNNNWRRPVRDSRFERLINWRMYRQYSGGLIAELASHQVDIANWAFDAEPLSVMGAGGIDYWKDGREVCDNVELIYQYPGGRKMTFTSILYNAHLGFDEQIMGDHGTLIITIGKGMYYREAAAKATNGKTKENWWAGATVTEQALEKGIPLFPEQAQSAPQGFLDREVLYAKRWLASMGIYEYEEPHEPYWMELSNFMASIRDGKPNACGIDIGMADARAVIYGNRTVDTGAPVYWPKKGA